METEVENTITYSNIKKHKILRTCLTETYKTSTQKNYNVLPWRPK